MKTLTKKEQYDSDNIENLDRNKNNTPKKLNDENVDWYHTPIPIKLLMDIKHIIDGGLYEIFKTSLNVLCGEDYANFHVFKISELSDNLIHRYAVHVETNPIEFKKSSDEFKPIGKNEVVCEDIEPNIESFLEDFPMLLREVILRLSDAAHYNIRNILLIDSKSCEFYIQVTNNYSYKFVIEQIGEFDPSKAKIVERD